MKVQNLRLESLQGASRVAATVIWEDSERPTQEICFSTPEEYTDFLYPNADSYLVGCILPAIEHGEQRIKLDGAVCPELIEGIRIAVEWFNYWYRLNWKLPKIESEIRSEPLAHTAPRNAGSFLSGGVDSLALLRSNHLTYPETHPRFIKHCVLVYGFGMGGQQEHYARQTEAFGEILEGLGKVARDAKVTLVPIDTNIRHLEDNLRFWNHVFHSAFLASVAHLLVPLVHTMSIAAGATISNIPPWGSHPLIDPNYSSAGLKIRHDGVTYSRLDKIKLVGEWDAALKNLHVCWHIYKAMRISPKVLNCGTCAKCVRTMAEFQAAGLPKNIGVFPDINISKQLLSEAMHGINPVGERFYRELIMPFKSQGRDDLVRTIKNGIWTSKIKRMIKRLFPSFFNPPWRSRWRLWRTRSLSRNN
ncbi:MAG: hypothetical protein PVH77_03725 [Phycisphaerales bacterium]|jgi:hypothetical protein